MMIITKGFYIQVIFICYLLSDFILTHLICYYPPFTALNSL